jgi:hypothetical protein
VSGVTLGSHRGRELSFLETKHGGWGLEVDPESPASYSHVHLSFLVLGPAQLVPSACKSHPTSSSLFTLSGFSSGSPLFDSASCKMTSHLGVLELRDFPGDENLLLGWGFLAANFQILTSIWSPGKAAHPRRTAHPAISPWQHSGHDVLHAHCLCPPYKEVTAP